MWVREITCSPEGDNTGVMNEIFFNGSRLIYLNKKHLKNNKITISTLGNEQCLYKEKKNHRYINPQLPYSSQIGKVKKMEVKMSFSCLSILTI